MLWRSCGFVQYSSAEASKAAVAEEHDQIIRVTAIELSIADDCEVQKAVPIVSNKSYIQAELGFGSFERSVAA